MIYVVILIILTLITSAIRLSILEKSVNISQFLHERCLSSLPQDSSFYEELAALVCGHSFETAGFIDLYKSSGLIHLFVVSGSHFVLLKKILTLGLSFLPVKKQSLLIAIVLVCYSFICLNNPPVIRGLLTFLVYMTLKNKNVTWPSHTVLCFIGLLGIFLNYKWANSLSYQMSWMASLVLVVLGDHLDMKSVFKRQFFMFFILSFCYSIMGSPQISSVICAVVFTPLLEFVLFPTALITTVFHIAEPVFYLMMTLTQELLSLFEFRTVPVNHKTSSHFFIQINWVLIFSVHILLVLKQRAKSIYA